MSVPDGAEADPKGAKRVWILADKRTRLAFERSWEVSTGDVAVRVSGSTIQADRGKRVCYRKKREIRMFLFTTIPYGCGKALGVSF